MQTCHQSKKTPAEYIQECKASGLTIKEFCRQNKIPLSTFSYWKKRSVQTVASSPKSKGNFPIISFPSAMPVAIPATTVELPSGIKITFPESTTAHEIFSALTVLS
jgi:hypothetical protein